MKTPSRVIFITGCSTGIGAATALHFAQQGWQVVATMRTPENGAALDHPKVRVLPLDVTNRDSITAAVAATIADYGRIDVLVNNAGYGVFGPFETASDAVIERQFQTNLFGLFDVTRAVLPTMRAQGSGVIINVSSIGGLMAFPLFSLYHATKFAVFGFSESLQYELAPFGIQVKVIAPGGVKTDFASRSLVRTFENDQHAYADTVAKVATSFAQVRENYASSQSLAEAIYGAATDGDKRLRYVVGADAESYLTTRAQIGDAAFTEVVRQRMGLTN